MPEGKKYDEGKPRIGLLPSDVLYRVLAEHAWGAEICRIAWARVSGEKMDEVESLGELIDSGLSEMGPSVIRGLEHGAEKYGAHNWVHVENGYERYWDALCRHAAQSVGALWYPQEAEDESGIPHDALVVCNAMFLLHFTWKS